ncbi:MAG: acyltransferase [Lachnospiraceae bacterium]|nr:acyltransferase [Lachnospiraceae bacterium]
MAAMQTKVIKQKENYFPVFVVVKVIAAFLVVLYHFQIFVGVYYGRGFNLTMMDTSFQYMTGLPNPGEAKGYGFDYQRVIELFFEISGFLAMYAYCKHPANDKKKAVLSKVVTLYPDVFVTSIVMCGLVFVFRGITGQWLFEREYGVGNVLVSFLFSADSGLGGYTDGINSPLWYVCTLVRCYLVFYLLQLLKKQSVKRIIYAFLAIGAGVLDYFNLSRRIPLVGGWACRGFFAFFVGVLVFELSRMVKRKGAVLIGIVLSFIYGIVCIKAPQLKDFKPIVNILLFPAFLLFFGQEKKVKNINLLRTLDGLSYSIYVIHVPVIFIYGILQYRGVIGKVNFYHQFFVLLIVIMLSFLYGKFVTPLWKELWKKISQKMDAKKNASE